MKISPIILISLAVMCFPVHASEDAGLVVMVAVDQLRRDRLTSSFSGGLGRLLREGLVFSSAQLNHGVTSTCPGHAVMSTGVNPGKAGISGNEYVDRNVWENLYCVHDDDPSTLVFGSSKQRSPRALKPATLGDWLKSADKESRVFAVGGKDRATITLAGHGADGVYWFDSSQGIFTSSRYYVDQLPQYVNRFNGKTPLTDGFIAKLPEQWHHPAGSYRKDDYPGEATEFKNSSGHALKSELLKEIGKHVYVSPFLDSATFELAKIIVEKEKLGQHLSIDMLAIALSATDTVGHSYGPFSAESENTLNNVDQELGEFLSFLDNRVGPDNYIVVLSADHGVAELPEWSKEQGTSACPEASGRIDPTLFLISLYWYVYRQYTFPFGNPLELVRVAGSQVSVNHSYARIHGIDPDEVVKGLQGMLESNAVIKRVWTVDEVKAGGSREAALLRNSYVAGKSGDLFLQAHRSCVARESGTAHGSVYDYDRNIPLVFFGRGINPGTSNAEAYSVDISPTLADFLGVESPPGLDGKVLKLE